MFVARRVFDDRSALVAGAIAATYSLFFYYAGLLQKEALMLFLLLAALALCLRAAEGDRPPPGYRPACSSACAVLTRGNTLLFAPFLLAWIALFGRGPVRRRSLAALCFTAGVAAIILPVTLRNYVVGARPGPLEQPGRSEFLHRQFPREQHRRLSRPALPPTEIPRVRPAPRLPSPWSSRWRRISPRCSIRR